MLLLNYIMSKKTQERYKLAGLCILCGKVPPRKQKQTCEVCAKRQRSYVKKVRDSRVAACCCIRCESKELVNKRFCKECYAKHLESLRQGRQVVKDAVFNAYGGYKCACCGETEKVFLSIDHINGNGCKHRKEIGQGNMYRWLRDNNYPTGCQVLCMNCQWGKKVCVVCPHKHTKETNG